MAKLEYNQLKTKYTGKWLALAINPKTKEADVSEFKDSQGYRVRTLSSIKCKANKKKNF